MERRQWLTGREASRALGVSPATIRNWIRAGRLDGFVVGKATRVRAASVERVAGVEQPVEIEKVVAT